MQTTAMAGLAIGLAVSGAMRQAKGHDAARQLDDTNRLLVDLKEHSCNLQFRDEAIAIATAQQRVDEMIEEINRSSTATWCAEQAVMYIAAESPGSQGVFASDVDFLIVGSIGFAYFDFPAGTTLQAAVNQINEKTPWIGATAQIDGSNSYRIAVKTTHAHAPYDRLEIRQYPGSEPALFAAAVGGNAMTHWVDYGCHIGTPSCASTATLYLSTVANLNNHGQGSTTLLVHGLQHAGAQAFTFASGTTQFNIIEAINSFEMNIRVTASVCATNPSRIELRSTYVGYGAFVVAMQVGGTPPIIHTTSEGGTPSYIETDVGRDRVPGDANCDRLVGLDDLLLVIKHWGGCPLPPFECVMDLTNDGAVNVNDLLHVIGNWGASDP